MKLILAAAAITFSFTGAALAGGNSDVAKAMADTLKNGTPLAGQPSVGSAASLVSGNSPTLGTGRSASGWGNTGSAALSPLGSVTAGAKSQGKKK